MLDFGIALFEQDAAEGTPSEVAGSPATISPEVLRAEHATPASDVYALGSVLYFTLAGQYYFGSLRGNDIFAALLERLAERFPWHAREDAPEADRAMIVERPATEDAAGETVAARRRAART